MYIKKNYLYKNDVITASKKINFFSNNNETFYIIIFTELYHERLFKLIESSHIVYRSKDN